MPNWRSYYTWKRRFAWTAIALMASNKVSWNIRGIQIACVFNCITKILSDVGGWCLFELKLSFFKREQCKENMYFADIFMGDYSSLSLLSAKHVFNFTFVTTWTSDKISVKYLHGEKGPEYVWLGLTWLDSFTEKKKLFEQQTPSSKCI